MTTLPTKEWWVDRIHGYLDDSVQGIINAGIELNKAQLALPKGDFSDMISNRLRISGSTAHKLMKIAGNEWIISNWKFLPPHWTTLYAVSLLDNDACDQAVRDGVINPNMEAFDVPRKALSAGQRPRGRPRKQPTLIEGTATEILSETPQAPKPAADPIAPSSEPETPAMARRLGLEEPKPPEPLGSSLAVSLTLYRDRHDVNFWQALMLAVGEWSKIEKLEDLVPTEDTLQVLRQYDFNRFINDLDIFRLDRLEADGDGVDDAA